MSREIDFRFCPECGGGLLARIGSSGRPAGHVCASCGRVLHLDPKLAACGLVVRQGRVLLMKRARPPEKGSWCLPGGFVDRGETLEGAAVREVGEETGLDVETTGLYGLYSYPDYPIVVAIYRTRIMGGELAVNEESLEAGWFGPDRLPWDHMAFPSTREALKAWAESVE
ncbi:MAG: NUDIX hydrolase [Proteobacteria bacterium]|nr:NUDIX hydrolase [Pseudomonadota bacterium]